MIIAYDPKGLSTALKRLGITVIHQDGATTFKGAYQQIRQLGLVSGHEATGASREGGEGGSPESEDLSRSP